MKTITTEEFYKLSTEEQDSFTGIIYWGYGTIEYYKNGLLHREDGPAVITNKDYKEWWNEGLLHNLNGPARIYPDGREGYFIHGEPTTKEALEFLRDIMKYKGIK
jgi:hypothetical protein